MRKTARRCTVTEGDPSLPPQRFRQVNTCHPRPQCCRGEQVLERGADCCADSRAPRMQVAISSPQLAGKGRGPQGEDGSGELPGPAGGRGCSVPGRPPPAQKPLRDRRCVLSGLPHGQFRAAANNTGCQRDGTQLSGDMGPRAEQGQRVCKAVFAQSLKRAQVTGRSPSVTGITEDIHCFFLSLFF